MSDSPTLYPTQAPTCDRSKKLGCDSEKVQHSYLDVIFSIILAFLGVAIMGYLFLKRRRWLRDLEEIRRSGESHINPEYFRNPFAVRNINVAVPVQAADGAEDDLSEPYCVVAEAPACYASEPDPVCEATDVQSDPRDETFSVTASATDIGSGSATFHGANLSIHTPSRDVNFSRI
jgi:hypothetical protein